MIIKRVQDLFNQVVNKPVKIYPLVVFRILFGAMMALSVVRFLSKGWVQDVYLAPRFFFSYWGMDFIQPYHPIFIYTLFGLMLIASLGIILGAYYRLSASLFFLAFTYIELIDKSTYLNHYYFVSLIAFLLIFLPAHRYFSWDVKRGAVEGTNQISAWPIRLIQFQLAMVYIFAGIAKLNPDWLLEAQPLRIWLQAHQDMPLLGPLLAQKATAYFFSWAGALYDLFIVFFLLNNRWRSFAYVAVVVFHGFTALLFPIGMFPYIMVLSTLIFFSEDFHQKVIQRLAKLIRYQAPETYTQNWAQKLPKAFILYILIQIIVPLRFLVLPGNLYWNELGYRYSWRVMLMEKAGYATFWITDSSTGKTAEIAPSDYLTPLQVKMMATQPDMILQFAHFLKKEFQAQGIANPEVRAQSYVTFNGRGSRPFLDSSVDLTQFSIYSTDLSWVLPFQDQ
ncbi:HTTM domain-containing protein [Cytophagales bacterium LB-30]|uniref:HTTM domain-containing protein n=1 Tax=Shiella aurantiaca TaxID=3058365 RepID=A0ABT8F4W5_9BACT|nr:HTTM domain-containing protein [Shiella aurantiaca]